MLANLSAAAPSQQVDSGSVSESLPRQQGEDADAGQEANPTADRRWNWQGNEANVAVATARNTADTRADEDPPMRVVEKPRSWPRDMVQLTVPEAPSSLLELASS